MTAPLTLAADSHTGPTDWPYFVKALVEGHRRPRAEISDIFLGQVERTLLSRAARIEGLGFGVKSVTVIPENAKKGLPTINGTMVVFDDATGAHLASVDSALVTNIKTVADSLLSASLLARKDSKRLLICGAGTIARTLIVAYPVMFPSIEEILIWNRTEARAVKLVEEFSETKSMIRAIDDLPEAAAYADIIATATMATTPVIQGAWLSPGTHLDLIGAFRADMREVDDTALRRARLFVDCRETTLGHIGELKIPLAEGVIREKDVLGDLYDLVGDIPGRTSDADITLFKNGGGAHLDLMTAFALIAASKDPT